MSTGTRGEVVRSLFRLQSLGSRPNHNHRHSFLVPIHRPIYSSACKRQPHFCVSRASRSILLPLHTHKRAALSPTTFLLAFALSVGVAITYTTWTSSTQLQADPVTEDKVAPTGAPGYSLTMAPAMPVGRPGNLSAEQEAKLKEMWSQSLEIFGVSRGTKVQAQPNGSASPNASGATTPTPEKKKSHRLSLFKKHKDDGDASQSSADGDGNDKHGQAKEFQQAIASMSPESLREAFWSMSKHDHPDALLLRFLRARKWDVHAALIMLISTMHWRSQDMHVDDDIMKNGEGHAIRESKSSVAAEKKEGEDFMAQLRMGKSFLHGTDKDGRPCCYVRVRLHRQGEQSEKSLERFTVYTIETARMLLRPPIDTATIVFDMTDFSMANMDYTPVKFMIKCFEANYPESLGSVLVYKSPWIFQGIWKIIKGWLDPVVAAKVHFASNVDELSEWIPRSRIMKELGGDEPYTYEYVEPSPTEDELMQDTRARDQIAEERKELVKSYERETVAWAQGDDTRTERSRLAESLAENYWRLDPYVRARSLYDRTGVMGQDARFNPQGPSAHQSGPSGSEDHVRTDGGGIDDELD